MSSDCISSVRSLSEVSDHSTLRFSVDLVSASRRNLSFLSLVSDSQWLQTKSTLIEAIRRYDQLWMPLIADLSSGSKPPMILPPLDVEWIWFCHTLNPSNYRHYCESRFSKLIGRPTIFDEENEEYALSRCRNFWQQKFPTEPFENEVDSDSDSVNYSSMYTEDLLDQVSRYMNLYTVFAEPYYSEMVYLVAAKQRYKGYIYMVHTFGDECSCFVPTSDVLLMWLTHQLSNRIHCRFEGNGGRYGENYKVSGCSEGKDAYETKMLWERIFDLPYEKAGGTAISRPISEPPFYWDVTNIDVNTKYRSMVPRFLFEVCLSAKLISNTKQIKRDFSQEFFRLRMARCHRELKMDKPISWFKSESWQKVWHLYCEFGTKGAILELRYRGGICSKGSSVQDSISFSWNDLLRAPSLMSGKDIDGRVRIVASITPPVQASYLLKCVPDRVTDDSGAMVSDVILKMNQYHPQEGRWLSRTILDHGGRECFVVRMRVGRGFWRRGGEAPTAVTREDRIIQICEGSWSYVVGSTSIGRSPEKVVGTATPKEPIEGFQACWSFSTGNELLIQWEKTSSISGLKFDVTNDASSESMVRLLQGRHLQFRVTEQTKQEGSNDEDEYVTVIRYTDDNPTGKATALINWKLMVVEILPEEDAVMVLLACLSILRSVSEMKREDVGGLLIRRRIREAKSGMRDWGSVLLHPWSYSSSTKSPYLCPWYWDANSAIMSQMQERVGSQTSSSYSQAEGGDNLYRRGIVS